MRAQRIILAIYLAVIVGGLTLGCVGHADCLLRC